MLSLAQCLRQKLESAAGLPPPEREVDRLSGAKAVGWGSSSALAVDPHPAPPPFRGRGRTAFAGKALPSYIDVMKVPYAGAIDCDVHPAVPSTAALLPYLDEVWRDQFVNRHIDRTPFTLMSYPPNSPLSARPDWRPASGLPGSDLDLLRKQALDPFGTSIAILNPLHGAIALFNEDMSAALCGAVNDWIAREWLDREPRLRASILVAAQNPDLAVAEIERLAPIVASCRCCCRRWATCRSAAGISGRSTRPPSGTASRSASTPAAPTGMRRRRPAGRRISSRIMSRRAPHSRTRSSASWPRACSRNSRA